MENSIYDKLKHLKPNSPSDWDTLRDYIQEVKDIAKERNIIMYNNDLDLYYKLTWTGGKNSSAKKFKMAKDELSGTALHMGV